MDSWQYMTSLFAPLSHTRKAAIKILVSHISFTLVHIFASINILPRLLTLHTLAKKKQIPK